MLRSFHDPNGLFLVAVFAMTSVLLQMCYHLDWVTHTNITDLTALSPTPYPPRLLGTSAGSEGTVSHLIKLASLGLVLNPC